MTTTFADLGVPASVCRALSAQGITAPFPIQAATLPDALAGRDLCGRAPTGSGKTIAFGIPLVTRIGRAEPKRPRALVLVPTRELAAQVREELVMLGGPQGPRVEAFYGGNGFERQLKGLRRGVDIAVGCPGRLADLIGRGDLRLDAVEIVVIDEADRMADMGFLPEVKRLLDRVPDDRQTLLFSATLDGAVDELIRRYQKHPARHELAADPRDGSKVEHLFWTVARDERIGLCAKVVSSLGPTIVFCRTKRGADRVARQLEAAGVRAAAIHGDRSQGQRERALAAFQHGQVDALVATDVAARGIHVDDVAGVVHLDPPADEKDYIHRSGRTGRAGSRGVVVSFVAPEQRRDVAKMQRMLGMPTGTTTPDATGLPQGEARPTRRSRPRPAAATETSRPRRPRPSNGRGAAKPGGPARKPGSRPGTTSTTRSGPKSGPKPGARSGPKSGPKTGPKAGAKSSSKLNRKARRAHLQPGGPAPTSASKGHRRQPTVARAH